MSRSRIGRWLGLLAVALTASPAAAQTYTWNTTTADNAWMSAANWTGGAAGHWPGLPAVPSGSSGSSTDLAVIDTFAFPAANGLGIDLGAAGGELDLAAIQFTSGSGNLQIGSSSGTGLLVLNGATVNGVSNVILANTSTTNDLTLANTPAGTGGQVMGLRLGNADNVLLVNAGRTLTVNNVISGAFFNNQPIASTIAVQGGGTVVLGNEFNAFTGAVSVTGGSTLSAAADGSFGQQVPSSRVILNNGTLLATSSFTLDPSRPIVVGSADAAGVAGTISVASGQTLTYNGVIQDAGTQPGQLVKSGTGVLLLGGTSTYTGGTTISAGALRADGDNILSPGGAVVLANTAGALFDLNGSNQTIGSLAGGGASGGNVNIGSGSLTVGGDNTSTTFSGLFTGDGALTKTGTGTLTLRGSSTWTGPVNVTGGVLSIDSTSRLGSAGLVTLNGGTLQQTNPGNGGSFISATRGIAVGPNGGTVDVTTAGIASIYRGTITGDGNTLTKVGLGEFRYEGAGTANSTFTKLVVNQGLFRIGAGAAGSTEAGFGAVPSSPLSDAITLNGGAIGASLGLTLDANRGITLGTNGGTLNTSSATLTIPSTISGSGALTLAGGTQTMILSGANTYTGATNINGGKLQAGAANTIPSASAVNLANASGAVLDLKNFNQYIGSLSGGGTTGGNVSLGSATLTVGGINSTTTYAGVISGTGGLAVYGTPTGTTNLTLLGNNTYSGGTTVGDGSFGSTLMVNGQTGTQSGTGTGPVAVNTGAALGGNGQAAGAVSVNSGGHVIAGQGTAVNQQLSLGSDLTLANNSTIHVAVGNGATANDTSLAGSSQVAVAGVLGRATTADRVTIDLAFVAGGNLDLSGNTTYTRRVATYGSLSNLTPGTYTAADNVFDVTTPSFGVDPGWSVLVGQNGSALDVVFTPVPEPGAILAVGLAGLGLAGLARRARRRGAATLS
jgi:autotransporter-associated beta strand protein